MKAVHWAILLSLSPSMGMATPADVDACFVPAQDCAGQVVDKIEKTKRQLLIQAYGFTHPDIAQAVVSAAKRGVVVRVILDKSNEGKGYSAATFLRNAGIPVLIDEKVAIAHNKVMVIDDDQVISGSMNFTKAGATKNAENVVFMRSPVIAQSYRANWMSRAKLSTPWNGQ